MELGLRAWSVLVHLRSCAEAGSRRVSRLELDPAAALRAKARLRQCSQAQYAHRLTQSSQTGLGSAHRKEEDA